MVRVPTAVPAAAPWPPMKPHPQYTLLLKDLVWFVDRPREGWLLSSTRAKERLSPAESKLGGTPYSGGFEAWPKCRRCRVPLNFVIQLHKRRFPQMWFSRGKNLFQVFRCPNGECLPDSWDESDRQMLAVFTRTLPGKRRPLEYPNVFKATLLSFAEKPLSEHRLVAQRIIDYPSCYEGRDSWWGDRWVRFQEKYTSDNFENDSWFYDGDFWKLIQNREGIKIAGLPSWQQGDYPPKCDCGRTKTFIFQLASVYDPPVEVMIGDLGNIYYFACRKCGERSLETRWDCG